MATLTTSFQKIGAGSSHAYGAATGYLELWAKYNSQDTANNRTSVTVELRLVVSGGYIGNYQSTTWAISGSLSNSGDLGSGDYGSRTLGSATGNITHNNDGTKSVSFSGSFNPTAWGVSISVSGSATLPTIPRQATLESAPDFTDLDNPTITYDNPAGGSTSELKASIYNASGSICYVEYRDVNKTGTLSYTFNLTDSERATLRRACTGDSMGVRFYLYSKVGSSEFWTYLDKTFTAVNVNYIKISNSWKEAIPYIKTSGSWQRAIPYIKVNNTWKKGI